MPSPDQCPTCLELSQKIVAAVRITYAVTAKWQTALRLKDPRVGELAKTLAKVRANERRATRALQDHKDTHNAAK